MHGDDWQRVLDGQHELPPKKDLMAKLRTRTKQTGMKLTAGLMPGSRSSSAEMLAIFQTLLASTARRRTSSRTNVSVGLCSCLTRSVTVVTVESDANHVQSVLPKLILDFFRSSRRQFWSGSSLRHQFEDMAASLLFIILTGSPEAFARGFPRRSDGRCFQLR